MNRKIKLYADEDIPSAVVAFMRDTLYWDITYVGEQEDLREKEDLYHHRRAREEGRILLTRDKHYLDPWRFPFHKSSGVIILEEKNTQKMIHILRFLPRFLEQVLRERLRHRSFFKIMVSSSGAKLRYQDVSGAIEEEFYPWTNDLCTDSVSKNQ